MSEIEHAIPVIVCQDIQREHDFLVEVFGFASGGVHVDDVGVPVHAEVIAGATTFWLHAVSATHRMSPPGDTNHGGFVVHMSNLDEHFSMVKQAGARIESEPTDQDYGQREYGVSDPEGHRWWFATRI
ncbi:MAG: VOC family protein [Pseudomonadota bacterium]